MELLNFVFRLGVLFAIYGFLWGLIEIGFWMLSAGRQRSIALSYLIKCIKYFFLADVTFLFCINGKAGGLVDVNQLIFAGLILLTYFLGKLQQNQNRQMLFKVAARGMQMPSFNNFNMRYEIGAIVIALGIFGMFSFYPELSQNPMSLWFYESIVNIEDTPVFGFIFKIIGFFFLLNLIFKMFNAFNYILNGGKKGGNNGSDQSGGNSRLNDQFDDYEEVK